MIEVIIIFVPAHALAQTQIDKADERAVVVLLFEFEDDHGALAADFRDRGRRVPGKGEASHGLKRKNTHALATTLAKRGLRLEVDLVCTVHAQVDFTITCEKGLD